MRQIEIRAGKVRILGELNETHTADAIWKALPLSAEANTWGEEIYFSIPVQLQADDARAVVSLGDMGYWPPGTAFCMFFGRTPVSQGNEIRPASPVNVFGCIRGDLEALKQVQDGETVTIARTEAS
jgi:hypothetical protein